MLTENQVLAAVGEALQLALSTALKPGVIRDIRVSEGSVVIGVVDDGRMRRVNVTVEPVQESPMMPEERDTMPEEREEPQESFVAPAQAEEPPGPLDTDSEGAPESTEAPGAAQDVRDTTEDAGRPPQSTEVLGRMPAPRRPLVAGTDDAAAAEDVAKE